MMPEVKLPEFAGIATVLFVVAFFGSFALIQEQIQPEPKEPIQEIKSLNLDYDKCSVNKFSTNSPFTIKVKYPEPAIKQDIKEYHQNPESVFMYMKTDQWIAMSSESNDKWAIQVSLEFEDNNEQRWALIDYKLGDRISYERIDDIGNDWCRIFEISSYNEVSVMDK